MGYNPKYQINLSQTFNRAFSSYDNKVKDQLRETLTDPTFRSTFGKMVIDEIIKRTEGGVDRFGNKFAAYSRSYIDSDVFKIYGKSAGDVNLTLSGEMLSSLEVKGNSTLTVELVGDENKAKAHGHVFGLGKRKVKRDFLGLPNDVVDELMIEAMKLTRNDAFKAAMDFFEGTSLSDHFGQVGAQPEFDSSIFTTDVLSQIARSLKL